jgi:hypothetical protein
LLFGFKNLHLEDDTNHGKRVETVSICKLERHIEREFDGVVGIRRGWRSGLRDRVSDCVGGLRFRCRNG